MLNNIFVPAPVASPHVQLPTDALGALAHSSGAVVASASFRDDSRVDALSIIPDVQLEQTSAIPDIRFDIASLCVAEGISYRFTSNRVDIVPQRFCSNSRLKAYSDVTTRSVIAGEPLRQGARAELDGSGAERAPSTEDAARCTIHGRCPPKPTA